ncbi:ABC transporter ATP-binding protein [Paraburkholderia unamae]|uniref:Sulfonate transport system ATP-binding protein n=1 Tax=Paraburkholderia unamae TaxID=219649 RepID=A0ABX5KU50_9BURK|nr:ABC transporter ATP-binding protein [Paraburkholderia unamae]PVX85550.1 sulfonate transport system ATP-binding protein [Paraburkholderia unamae]RAR55241.1 sulfonate transport system ATP-binding protein [Paraburkholderia unamae]CAG9268084.1 ABC transporter domain-containing protein [Paraburkholderia unamae]
MSNAYAGAEAEAQALRAPAARVRREGAAASVPVAIENVSKTFTRPDGDAVPVLAGIDLTVAAGEVLCVLGASGCGKSTLLRIVAGLERADAGRVVVGSAVVEAAGLDRGFVFQDHRLVPWMSVQQNVELALHRHPEAERRRIAEEKLALVGLSAFRDAWPGQLSGGMAQRVAIARTLAQRPRVLLMDEPFGALDAITRMQLQDEFLSLQASEGITTILVTHDIEEAVYLGDRIVVLSARPGRVRHIARVDLTRPRNRADPAFGQQRIALYEQFFAHSQDAATLA